MLLDRGNMKSAAAAWRLEALPFLVGDKKGGDGGQERVSTRSVCSLKETVKTYGEVMHDDDLLLTQVAYTKHKNCLLSTSDAADDLPC